SDWTFGVASSVITTASACWAPPVDPLPMLILPPVRTQVTDAGFTPARSVPPTLTCALVPVATLGVVLDAGDAVWPPPEHPTRATEAAAQPRVPIAAARRRFTCGSFLRASPQWRRPGASTERSGCYRSQISTGRTGRLRRCRSRRRDQRDAQREMAGKA